MAYILVGLFLFLLSPQTLSAAEQEFSANIVSENATETVLTETVPNHISLSAPVQSEESVSSNQPNSFNHLYVFSIGGLLVLFLLWTGLAVGPIWFLIFTAIMYIAGWISLPLQIQTLPITKIILYFIVLKIALYILGFALKFLIKGESGELAKTYITLLSTDLILIVPIIWTVVNGVFIYAPTTGRYFLAVLLILLTILVRIPVKFASSGMFLAKFLGSSSGCLSSLRPLYVLFSVWMMSIWL